MKLLYGAAIAISVIVVLAPSAIGLTTTVETFDQHMTDYGDDGARYVIRHGFLPDADDADVLAVHADTLAFLTDAFATHEDQSPSGAYGHMPVINAWKELAESWGWTATVLEDQRLSTLVATQDASVHVALLDRSGVAVPFLLVDTDNIFVTAYEANTGKVLYRRNAFMTDWSGLSLELRPPAAGPR